MCWNCLKSVQPSLLNQYLTSFYGHGSDDADWIFISIEERGSPCSAFARLDFWDQAGKPHLVDAPNKESHLRSIDPSMPDIYGSGGSPASQSFLRYVESIVAMTNNPQFDPASQTSSVVQTLDTIRKHRTGSQAAKSNSIALLELFPLPHHRSSDFDYGGMSVRNGIALTQFNKRSKYNKWCAQNRTSGIVNWICSRPKRENPIKVVVLGHTKELPLLYDALVHQLSHGAKIKPVTHNIRTK